MTIQTTGISGYSQMRDQRTAGYMPVIKDKSAESLNDTAPAAGSAESAAPAEHSGFYNFVKGIFDVINPLQHIPVVSAIYRHVTGDEPGPMARMIGDTLYGGPIGGVIAVADIALEKVTGKDMGATAFAMLDNKDKTKDQSTMLAQNSRQTSAPAVIARNEPEADTTPTPAKVPASKTMELARMASPSILPQQNAPVAVALPAATGQIAAPPHGQVAEAHQQIPILKSADADAYFQTTDPASDKKQIAMKMMEALDKYATMKKSGLAPQTPALSAAF